jgi:short-subunit dehydrogenase
MKRLNDGWVLVTGSSSGLGEEFAKQLAHRGLNLILTARSRERLEKLAENLRRVAGVDVRTVPADLAADDGARRLCAAVDELGLEVRHLINNAGFGKVGPFATFEAHREAEMVRVNAEALTALTAHFLPAMRRAKAGGILNVASTAGHQPVPYMATYAATKAFVIHFSLALAAELEGSGVHVMTLCPGPVPTGFQERAGIDAAKLFRPAVMNAAEIVEQALDAYDKGKALFVPGTINRAQTVMAKLLPRPLLTWGAVKAADRMGRR